MPRAKNNVAARRRSKKLLNAAKGMWGSRSKLLTVAKHAVHKSWQYQYRDRKQKKRQFRRLWIARINAAARSNGTSYSRLMGALRKSDVALDRKLLSDLAIHDPAAFTRVIEHVS
jgi:large subunit ribosomal protein L20